MSIKTEVFILTILGMSVSVIQVKKVLKATFLKPFISRSRLIFEGENVRYEFVRKVEDQVKSNAHLQN